MHESGLVGVLETELDLLAEGAIRPLGLRFAVRPDARGGTAATLLLRPEQLEAAPATPDGLHGIVDARLEQSVFLGAARKFVCRLANGASLTAAPTGADGDSLSAVAPGDPIRLAYRRDRPHLSPEGQDDA